MGEIREKKELPYIEEIIERLVEAYIDPSNSSAWFVAFSNGKDSSCMGYCIWKAVERVPAHLRTRMVYFATSDTLLEHPEKKELMMCNARKLPWHTRATTIRKMYEGAGECPIQVDSSIGKPCGGSSLNGCMLCMMGGGTEDKMLQAFIDKGQEWAIHVSRLRKLIRESLYDARMRRPINYWRKKKMNWANPFIDDYEEKKKEWRKAEKTKATREAFYQKETTRQDIFKEMSEGLCHDTLPVYPNLSLAGYTLQARIFLFKAILYTQEKTGIPFLSEQDIQYIKKVWKEECGWEENEQDLLPEFPFRYEGALVLNSDYSINVEDEYGIVTTIPNLTIYADGVCMETGKTVTLPQIPVKKLNPPPRKNKENRMTKKELIAELNRTWAKTINVQPSIKERYQVFYIERAWGGDEASIIEHLERSERKAKRFIPFYWLPAYSVETRIDWRKLKNLPHMVYWNTVVFIVCEPHIQTKEQAIQYVDWYIQQGEVRKSYFDLLEEERQANISEVYQSYLCMEPSEAKIQILRNTEDPDELPDEIKRYANVTDEELTIARVMRYHSHDEEKVASYCQGEVWERVAILLVEGLEKHEARQLLLERAYDPKVLPGFITMRVGLGHLFLKKARLLRMKGIAGKEIRKHFPISFWIKDMTADQAKAFVIETGYQENEIGEDIKTFTNISDDTLTIARTLCKEGCSSEQIGSVTDKIEEI